MKECRTALRIATGPASRAVACLRLHLNRAGSGNGCDARLPSSRDCLTSRPPTALSKARSCPCQTDIGSVQSGRSRFSRCYYLIIDLCSHLFGGSWAPGVSRSHLNSAVELGCSGRNCLYRCVYRLVAIAQWFVHLSAHPQPMEQYRQLSRHRNHRWFLGIFPSALRQLQPPSPQITIFSKRSQNVVRALHQHRSQIPVSFFADVLLWFATLGHGPLQPDRSYHRTAPQGTRCSDLAREARTMVHIAPRAFHPRNALRGYSSRRYRTQGARAHDVSDTNSRAFSRVATRNTHT
jgi:hypothetical protein